MRINLSNKGQAIKANFKKLAWGRSIASNRETGSGIFGNRICPIIYYLPPYYLPPYYLPLYYLPPNTILDPVE
jgi:hypothetical protein